jgi:hypothetical protein
VVQFEASDWFRVEYKKARETMFGLVRLTSRQESTEP